MWAVQNGDFILLPGAPKKYFPDPALIETCQELAKVSGATLRFEEDPLIATKGADVLYTDVWVSMGEPVEVWEERIRDLSPYQINQTLMENAGPQARFMHCLPAFHDRKTEVGREMGERFQRDAMEVTDQVFEGPQSIVFDEAENRMHTIKAVMAGNPIKDEESGASLSFREAPLSPFCWSGCRNQSGEESPGVAV